MTTATVESPPVEPEPKLHQPKRALIAAGEVVAAALLVIAAVWCWNRGVVEVAYLVADRAPLPATRYHGNWVGGAIGIATVAGVLLLDALRQTLLAVRTRGRKRVDEPDV